MKFAKSIGWLIICGFVVAGDAQPQLPSLIKPDDARKRLGQRQKEARDALARLDGSNGSVTGPPEITPAEIEERRRDLEQMRLVTTNSLRDIEAGEQARKALENMQASVFPSRNATCTL